MSLFSIFGGGAARKPAKRSSDFQASAQPSSAGPNSSQMNVSSQGNRRELLRVVLRDTLRRNGIPTEWITAETITAMSRTREPGVLWRLTIKHWDERLPNHLVAIQNALITRLYAFDPMAQDWLTGIAWQFALADESVCPPMPHPGSWTAAPRAAEAVPAAAQNSGDVIAGPVSIESPSGDVKADLERLMSVMDAQYHGSETAAGRGYAATEPAKL
jgi:hypothetical protein